ncbi:hypothetical protein LHJ74_30795 [Streptomyces sp. N2-109]|uniref:Uncharacterized protein n=1 Tax=Streptomyces gossypii TaxID=2883101 RepID=A0ABT2K261_9ACTN|nr:hypothetical protein [Streptomyces gossypii]MCT2594245.1 hypothetical protein [Streptomyces gossypii]
MFDDERRERYAAAIIEPDGVLWFMLTEDEKRAEYARADAAIAVADEERADDAQVYGDAVSAYREEILDLRKEFYEEATRLRAELDVWKGRYRSSVETYRDVTAEIARLRSDCEMWERRALAMADAAENRIAEVEEAQRRMATIRTELTSRQRQMAEGENL